MICGHNRLQRKMAKMKLVWHSKTFFSPIYTGRERWLDKITFQNSDSEKMKIFLRENKEIIFPCPWNVNTANMAWDYSLNLIKNWNLRGEKNLFKLKWVNLTYPTTKILFMMKYGAHCSCSVVSDSLRPCGLQCTRLPCPSLSPGVCSDSCPLSWRCHPTILYSAPASTFAFNLSQYQGLFKESALHIRWSKYWSFSFIINSSSEYSGLISFRIDWFDLLAVQRTLKSLLQHYFTKF